MTEVKELYENIIKNNYCIGCGACASVKNSPFKIHMNDFGNLVAYPYDDLDYNKAKVLRICPFSNYAKNEDEISEMFFSEVKNVNPKIGKYIECFAGFVNEGLFREKGSSGGFGKWLGYILLKEDKIDYLVQVLPNQSNDPNQRLFDYAIISDKEKVLIGSKSAYYPVTLENVLKTIKETDGRYAITGVPCFIKALRLISSEDEIFKKRIKYTIGIICGGVKSANQSKIIAWQLGVKPENLVSIDFRRKSKKEPASHKFYQVWSSLDKVERYKDSFEIFGTDWGSGYFKPNACDYCDDVVGETSDVSIGDAWLPQFVLDPGGTSVIIIRNQDILDLVNKYKSSNSILLHNLTAEEVINSQEGGFRHRREGLSFRIAKKEKSKTWYPKKRIFANEFKITKKRKAIYSLREIIAKQSHLSSLNALNNNDITIFLHEMGPLAKKYYKLNYGTLLIRGLRKFKRLFISFLRQT